MLMTAESRTTVVLPAIEPLPSLISDVGAMAKAHKSDAKVAATEPKVKDFDPAVAQFVS